MAFKLKIEPTNGPTLKLVQPKPIAVGKTITPTNTIKLLPQQQFLDARSQNKPISYSLSNPNQADYLSSMQPTLPQYSNNNVVNQLGRSFTSAGLDSLGALASTILDTSAFALDKVGLDGLAEKPRQAANAVDAYTKDISTYYNNPEQRNPEEENTYVQAIGSGAGTLAVDIPTFKAGKYGRAATGAKNANMTYVDIKDALDDDGNVSLSDEARAYAGAGAVAALDLLGMSKILGGGGGASTPIKNTLVGTGTEAGTEGVQQVIQNAASGDKVLEGVAESVVAGGVLGGGVAGGTSVVNYTDENLRVKDEIRREVASTAKASGIVDLNDPEQAAAFDQIQEEVVTRRLGDKAAKVMFGNAKNQSAETIAFQLQDATGETVESVESNLNRLMDQVDTQNAIMLMENPVTGGKLKKGTNYDVTNYAKTISKQIKELKEKYKAAKAQMTIKENNINKGIKEDTRQLDRVEQALEKAENDLNNAQTIYDIDAVMDEIKSLRNLARQSKTQFTQEGRTLNQENNALSDNIDQANSRSTKNKMTRNEKKIAQADENRMLAQEEIDALTADISKLTLITESRSSKELKVQIKEKKKQITRLKKQRNQILRKLEALKAKSETPEKIDAKIARRMARHELNIGKLEEELAALDEMVARLEYDAESAPATDPAAIEKLAYGQTKQEMEQEIEDTANQDSLMHSIYRGYNKATNEGKTVLRAIQEGVDAVVSKMLQSGATSGVGTAKFIKAVFGDAGYNDQTLQTLIQHKERSSSMIFQLKKAFQLLRNLDQESSQKIYEYLNVGKDRTTSKRQKEIYADMTESEKFIASFVNETFTMIHDFNVELGLVSEAVDKKNRGKWFMNEFLEARAQTWIDDFAQQAGMTDGNKIWQLTKYQKRKDDTYSQFQDSEVTDLGLLLQLAMSTTMTNMIARDTFKSLWDAQTPDYQYFSETAKPGFTHQLPASSKYSNLLGEAQGMWVRDDVFYDLRGYHSQNKVFQGAWDLMSAFDNNTLRRLQKSTLTVYNPAVWVGNYAFNYPLAYLAAGSVDMPKYITMYNKYAAQSLANPDFLKNNKYYIEAQNAGVPFGQNDVAKYVNRSDLEQMAVERNFYDPKEGVVDKAQNFTEKYLIDSLGSRYGGIDDASKLALYQVYREGGLSPEQAALNVSRSLQNYSQVGLIWQFAAKIPIFGKPFARFTGDLITRILPNLIVDHPLRVANAVGWVFAANALTAAFSGEDDELYEDKSTMEKVTIALNPTVDKPELDERNNRFGGRKLFGVLPTNVKFGEWEYDYSRWTGMYFMNDPQDGYASTFATQASPIGLPKENEDGTLNFNTVVQDPTVGPLVKAGLAWKTGSDAIENFMGEPIVRAGNAKDESAGAHITAEEKRDNIFNYLLSSYTPPGYADSVAALQSVNNLRDGQAPSDELETRWGSTTTNAGNLWRGLALRATVQNDEKRTDRQGKGAYAESWTAVKNSDKFSSKDWEDYTRLNKQQDYEIANLEKFGEVKSQEAVIEDWATKLANPTLFRIDKEQAIEMEKRSGEPRRPVYNLSEEQYKTFANYKLEAAQGKSAEAAKFYRDNPWIQDVISAEADYFDKLKKDGKIKDPGYKMEVTPMEMSDSVTSLMARFNEIPEDDKAARSLFLRQNKELSDYFSAAFEQNQKEREALGYPLLAEYPTPSEALQAKLDKFFTLPSGTGQRSAYIKANPDIKEWFILKNIYDIAGQFGDGTYAKGTQSLTMDEILKTVADENAKYSGSGGYGGGSSKLYTATPGPVYFKPIRPTVSTKLAKSGKNIVKRRKK